MGTTDEIETKAAPLLAEAGLDLVLVEYRRESPGWVLRFYIDKPGGLSVDDCAFWNRRLGELVEASGLVSGRYFLEVSSPGLNRPLRKREDFARYQGREARVTLFAPLNNQRHFHGHLEGVEGEHLLLRDRTSGAVKIPLAGIAGARLDLPEGI
jgi:ribosome maturation factor RimP